MRDNNAVDPANAIVKLCAQGMEAEAEGRIEHARELFIEAWRVSSDDYEGCIAAHYLARHQATAEETLWWNQEALRRANAAVDYRVSEFYPSLYLNVAYALERLGQVAEAYQNYTFAAVRLDDLPANGYTNMIRMAVAQGQERTRGAAKACASA
jgi:hypothetical protein